MDDDQHLWGHLQFFFLGYGHISELEVRKLAVLGLNLHQENDSDMMKKVFSVQYLCSQQAFQSLGKYYLQDFKKLCKSYLGQSKRQPEVELWPKQKALLPENMED